MAARKRHKRAKPGPKPLPAARRRSHVVSVRLTPGQLEAFRANAGEDETVAACLLKRALRGLKIRR